MEKVKLNFSHNNSVARLLLSDGKGNVLDNTMMLELIDCFNQFKSKSGLKLIVIEGEGKHFSFGASVEEHQQEFASAMLKTFHKLFFTIRDLSVPLLAKVSGQCLGGGMELALMCHFIFADQSAKFGQPEISLGVFPPPASIILPERIGLARAEELLITGKIISASESQALGLINHLVNTKEELNSETELWIEQHIVPKSASSLRFATNAARIKFNHVLSNFLPQLEYLYLNQLMQTRDANEGINSFIEKRKPQWQDC